MTPLYDDLRIVVMAAVCFHEGFTVREDREPAVVEALTAACQRIGEMVGIEYTFGEEIWTDVEIARRP